MDIYKLLKILSSESKAKILIHFLDCNCGDVCVGGICSFTGLKQANVSKHIMALREEKVLEATKDGREVIYTINPGFESKWGQTVRDIVNNDPTLSKLKCKHNH